MAGVMGMDPSLNGHHTGMAAAQPGHLPVSHAAWDSLPSAGPKFSTHPAALEMNYDSPSHDQLHLHQLHAPFSDYSPHLDGSPHTSLPSYLSHTQPCEPLLAGPRGPGLLDATSQRDPVTTSVTAAAASVSACGGLAGGALFSGLAIGRPGWRGRLALAVRRAAAAMAAQLPPLGTTVKLAVVLVVLVVALMGVQRLLSDPATLQYILDYANQHPGLVVPLFMLANATAPLILLPSAPFQILAGAVWGMPLGMIISGLASFTANISAFMVGRHFMQAKLSNFISSKVSTFPAIQAAILSEGWRLVLMLRVSPVMPDSLMNYALSLTNITLAMFAGCTAIAMVPWTTLYVYLGAASKDIIATLSGKGGSTPDGQEDGGGTNWVNLGFMAASFCTAVAAVLYLGRVIRRAVQKAEAGLAAGAAGVGAGVAYSAVALGDDLEGATGASGLKTVKP